MIVAALLLQRVHSATVLSLFSSSRTLALHKALHHWCYESVQLRSLRGDSTLPTPALLERDVACTLNRALHGNPSHTRGGRTTLRDLNKHRLHNQNQEAQCRTHPHLLCLQRCSGCLGTNSVGPLDLSFFPLCVKGLFLAGLPDKSECRKEGM